MSLRKFLAAAATIALATTAALADPPDDRPGQRDEQHQMKGPGQAPQKDNGPRNDAMRGDMRGPTQGKPMQGGPRNDGGDMRGPAMQGQPMQGAARNDGGAMRGHQMGGPMGAQMSGPGKDWHWKDDRGGWHRDHDRYWRPDYRGFAPRDRIFADLRRHNFARFDGEPYWFQGRYVVRSFDRSGRPVFVEINPYSGVFIGVVRF